MHTGQKSQSNLIGRIISVALVLILVATACQSAPPPAPTATAIPPSAVPPTNTPAPTNTSVPTATPVPTDTPTPEPTATSTPDLKATEAAQATEAVNALAEEAQKKFAEYKLTVNEGGPAWVQYQALPINLDQYGQTLYFPLDESLSFTDFIIHTDIKWESSGGLAGCGLMLRSEKDFSKGSQYRFQTMRLSGYPAWDVEHWNFGKWQTTITGNVRSSKSIDLDQGAVNEYLVHVKGSTITVYANRQKIGSVNATKLNEGLIAFMAFQDSGATTCEFDNTWIWGLE